MPSLRLAVLPALAFTAAASAHGPLGAPLASLASSAVAAPDGRDAAAALESQLDELSRLRGVALRARNFDQVQEIDRLTVELLERWEAQLDADAAGNGLASNAPPAADDGFTSNASNAASAAGNADAPNALPGTEFGALARRPAPKTPSAPSDDASFVAFAGADENGTPFNARRAFKPIDFKQRFGDSTFVLVTEETLVTRRVPKGVRPAPGVVLGQAGANGTTDGTAPDASAPQSSGRRTATATRPAPGTQLGGSFNATGGTPRGGAASSDAARRIEAIRQALADQGG